MGQSTTVLHEKPQKDSNPQSFDAKLDAYSLGHIGQSRVTPGMACKDAAF